MFPFLDNFFLHFWLLYPLYFLWSCFFFFAFIISLVFFFISFLLAPNLPDTEKISPYECGFEPFDDARNQFDIKFYLIAIFFLIFDVETIYLYPWVINTSKNFSIYHWTLLEFLGELLFGYFYILKLEALNWKDSN